LTKHDGVSDQTMTAGRVTVEPSAALEEEPALVALDLDTDKANEKLAQ
jgi:hypothetical protein